MEMTKDQLYKILEMIESQNGGKLSFEDNQVHVLTTSDAVIMVSLENEDNIRTEIRGFEGGKIKTYVTHETLKSLVS